MLRFEFRPDAEGRKQDELIKQACQSVLAEDLGEWQTILTMIANTEANPERTLLEKHLAAYTARNTADFFIHKDLGGFLRRELDFYIKNEVMYLDDIENQDAPKVELYLAKLKAIRRIAHKIIAFLAQLEEFQKKLWLKKKFVVETQYVVTLDRLPAELRADALANEAQLAEWRALGMLPEEGAQPGGKGATGQLALPGAPGQPALPGLPGWATPYLPVDTKHFLLEFKRKLVASIDNLNDKLNGLLIHSENFQALNLLQERYREQVKCIYIDPPYNTSSSAILYKNNYRHSSWGNLMLDRLALLRETMPADGAIFISIDKLERIILEHMLDNVFGNDNRIEELIWSMNTNNSQAPNYSTNHEYVEVYARNRKVAELDKYMFREPKPGYIEVMALIESLSASFPPVHEILHKLKKLYDEHRTEYREEVEAAGLDWETEKANDPWKGLYSYNCAEYRDSNGTLVDESLAETNSARIWIWQEGDASMPATKQSPTCFDPNHKNYRFYKPIHPITGKPCPHPKSGWKFAYEEDGDSPDKRSFIALGPRRAHRLGT